MLVLKLKIMFVHQKASLLFLLLLTLIIESHQDLKDSDKIIAAFKKYQAECLTEEGLEPATINKDWKENNFPNDEKIKCYYKCLFMKLGSLNEKGEVIEDTLGKGSAPFNDPRTTKEIVEECGGIEGADLCDTAYKLAACVRAAQLD